MPALVPTSCSATVTWIGRVADSEARLVSDPLEAVDLTFSGIAGDCHGGLTRPSCVRVRDQYPEGTEIRNVRQLSVVSEEELAAIAAEMGVDRLEPGIVGASLAIRGIPDFTRVPPGARLQAPSGATLVVDMENQPCNLPAKFIDAEGPGQGRAFKAAAKGRRGVTAWVECEGALALGDSLRLHIPGQPAWPHRAAAIS